MVAGIITWNKYRSNLILGLREVSEIWSSTMLRYWLSSVLATTFAIGIHATQVAPFEFADFSWLNGNSRQSTLPLKSEFFVGQFSFDSNYVYDFVNPSDHTLSGSSNTLRTNELQINQIGIGGDFSFHNVNARLMTQFGLYSSATPSSDSSPSRGQWNLANAYRYFSEANAGYHFDVLYGLNIDAGLFLSHLGMNSYYNFENWVYQSSFIPGNLPWYLSGIRIQAYLTDRLKTEIWIVNGWQSYGMFNQVPGFGLQVKWHPSGDWALATNYYLGYDTLDRPNRLRFHSDTHVQLKYLDNPNCLLSKAAISVAFDGGCENGDGVSCTGAGAPAQYYLGGLAYNRFWFFNDTWALTVGGGAITNPGRYLLLIPPVNGATSISGTPSFSANPGDGFVAWDTSVNVDYMPVENLTLRLEYIHRESSAPYFAGSRGMTPPGGNQNAPGSVVAGWSPDLVSAENRFNLAFMVRL
jgi:hypothetical protein